jgi:hypothetical protein
VDDSYTKKFLTVEPVYDEDGIAVKARYEKRVARQINDRDGDQ